MAIRVVGAGATITAPTIEQFLASLVQFGQAMENTLAKNPSNINNLTSSISQDLAGITDGRTDTLTASISVPAQISSHPSQPAIIAGDYLTGVTYSSGDSGDFQGGNWVQDLVLAVIEQHKKELAASRQPFINYEIRSSGSTATSSIIFTANMTLPLVSTLNAQGQKTSDGMVYLP